MTRLEQAGRAAKWGPAFWRPWTVKRGRNSMFSENRFPAKTTLVGVYLETGAIAPTPSKMTNPSLGKRRAQVSSELRKTCPIEFEDIRSGAPGRCTRVAQRMQKRKSPRSFDGADEQGRDVHDGHDGGGGHHPGTARAGSHEPGKSLHLADLRRNLVTVDCRSPSSL